jgi:hypothetical protein
VWFPDVELPGCHAIGEVRGRIVFSVATGMTGAVAASEMLFQMAAARRPRVDNVAGRRSDQELWISNHLD